MLISLRRVQTLARAEVSSLLDGPLGWLLMSGWLLLTGAFWLAMVDRYAMIGRDQVYSPFGAATINPIADLIAPWQANLSIILLMIGPAVTMRAFAEEVRRGTMELLLASPASAAEIVIGKYLGGLWFVGGLILGSLWMPLLVASKVDLDLGALVVGAVGQLGFAAAVLAVGLVASATTDSPAVSLVLSFAVCLCLWIAGWIDPDPTSVWTQLSLSGHLATAWTGLVRLSDVVYLGGLITSCLVVATLRVEANRYL